ncbi:MAG: tRNA glutamyl-Q synthetase [Halobacteriovoraceae bacterium]|nr:tRNA glutamyl-Q synthetase [Halobacteriovoraceae bacterium]
MTIPKTRFAPTPSGFLHLGNVLNLLFCEKWSKSNGAQLLLRIDDIDRERFRLEYLEDIFKTIDWLGIKFDEGPSGVEDFLKNYSQHTKLESYKRYLNDVLEDTFSCSCSRKELQGLESYPGTCRDKGLVYKKGLNLRLKEDDSIIYKKDLLPSYNWACVIDDFEMNITHIVRGDDLLESSLVQDRYRLKLNLPSIASSFHQLILSKNGEKLSKSTMKNGRPLKEIYSKNFLFNQLEKYL